jgi:hypothetical protein
VQTKVVAAVATGSLPVSAAEILRVASALDDNALLRENIVGSHQPIAAWEAKSLIEAKSLRYCATVLKRHAEYIRRQVEHSTGRQPEENNSGLPRRVSDVGSDRGLGALSANTKKSTQAKS